MLKKILAIVIILAMTLTFAACGNDDGGTDGAVVLTAAHAVAPTHPYHLGLERFAELVYERTDGAVIIDIFHSGTLGNERDNIEGLQLGTVDIAVSSTAPLSGFVPEFLILDLPYLFEDNAHADRVLDGSVGTELIELLAEINIVGAAFWENGFRNLTNSRGPIESVADMAGLSLRTQENELHLEAFRALGAVPQAMAWSEVFTALQQGVIDGQENPIPIIYAQRLYEVQEYLSLTRHLYSPAMLLISGISLQQFDEDIQRILVDTAREVAPYQRELVRSQEAEQLLLLEERGMTISRPNPMEFRDAIESVYQNNKERLGADLIDRILNY